MPDSGASTRPDPAHPPTSGLVEVKSLVQRADGQFHVLFVDHDRGLDFGGRDHLDVDALFRQAAEHLAGHADVTAHADADDRNLARPGPARPCL